MNWDAIVPATAPHVTSLGFYRPEWTRNHLPQGHTPADFHAADDRFWTGRSLDPAHPDTTDGWRAPALSVADRSTVSSLPFATTFNTGHGLRWYEEGRVTSETPWNHLGLQDRLPSRRWVVRTEGARPQVAFDFEDAWRGGNSVLVSGALTAPVTLDLYATRLPLRGARSSTSPTGTRAGRRWAWSSRWPRPSRRPGRRRRTRICRCARGTTDGPGAAGGRSPCGCPAVPARCTRSGSG